MAQRILTPSGKEIQSYEEWKKNGSASSGSSGTGVQIVTPSGKKVQSYEEWKSRQSSMDSFSSGSRLHRNADTGSNSSNLQATWLKKYQGKGYDSLASSLLDMEDGEEKDWLTAYADRVKKSEWNALVATKPSDWIQNSDYGLKAYQQDRETASYDQQLQSWINQMAEAPLRDANPQYYQMVQQYRNDTSYKEMNDRWSEEQRRDFGYLYAQDKKKAEEYAIAVNEMLNAQAKNQQRQAVQEKATSGFLTGLGETGKAIAAGMTGIGDYMSDSAEYTARGRITERGDSLTLKEYSDTVIGGVSEHLNKDWGTLDKSGWVKLMEQNANYQRTGTVGDLSSIVDDVNHDGEGYGLGDMYGVGVSAATSMLSAHALGRAGSLVQFFGSAAASAVDDARSRGASDEQALVYGTALGASEALTELIPIDSLLNIGKAAELKGALWSILKESGEEFLGEGLNSVISSIADHYIMADKSNFQVQKQAYMDNGLTEEEAKKQAWKDLLKGIAYDAVTGAASGALSGGATLGIHRGLSRILGNATADSGNATVKESLTTELSKATDTSEKSTPGGVTEQSAAVDDKMSTTESTVTKSSGKNESSSVKVGVSKMETVQQTADIESFAQQFGTQADAVRRNYLEGQQKHEPENLQEYEVGFQIAFAIGLEGGKVEALSAVPYLSQSQKEIAFELGQSAAAASQKAAVETKKQPAATAQLIGENGTENVSIAEIVSMDDNNMTFRLEDGRTVTDDDLNFDKGQQVLTAVWDTGMDVQSANTVMAESVANTASEAEQAAGIDEAYRYGSHGYSMDQLLKHGTDVKALTDVQMKAAWNAGQLAHQQAAASPAAAKVSAKAYASGVYFDAGSGNVTALSDDLIAGTSKAAKAGVKAAQILQKLGIGRSYYFFESYVNSSGDRVYKDADGAEHEAPNGWYDPNDGSIHIDLNAGGDASGLTLYTLSHELTHFVEQWSKPKYQALADFLVESYGKGASVDELVIVKQKELSESRGKAVTYDEAYSEFIADSMEAMLSDGNVLEKLAELKTRDKSLFDKIKEFFDNLAKKIREAYKDLTPDSAEGKAVLEMKDQIEQIQQLFAEALADAGENFQAAAEIGLEMDMETESVSPAVMYSERTWRESDYVQERNKAAQEISEAIGVSVKKAKQYIDSVNSIAKMIAEDRTRLDYFSSPGRSSFIGNVEYGGSFDFSTLCKKRRLLTGTFTAIQKALPNTALTANEILEIRNRMKDAGLEVSCGLCYVEGSRANMGQFAKEFLRLYKQYYPDAWQPNMADVNTPDGIEWVRINHPECYEQYEYFWNHYGTLKAGDKNLFASQQKPKLYQLHTEYKGEILQKFKGDDNVEVKNLNGGIRLQSFSDFEIVHLIDTMQIVMDMSRVGLAGQAYTKVPDFAWALGDTGLKINLSLIAKGVDENGNLIFDDIEGMPIEEAMRLRDRYSANVGTILVAFNDAQLMAAMKDDRVDFIIPFHRSQWKKSQYEAMGLPAKTKDYTYMQNEKFIKPQYHEYRGRMVKDKATNYMPNEYWDFSKSGKENAVAYLEMCARNNKRPKFYKLLQNNGDGSYSLKADGSTDGYWKLLIDFKMYDNNGIGSPQMPVKPDFNMQKATRMLADYAGGHSRFPVAQGIVDDFVKEYKQEHPGRQFSDRKKASGYDYSKPFSQQVDDWISGNFPAQDTLLVGGTPNVLTGIGFPSLPITITQTNLKANINGEYRGTPEEILDHIISSADFKRLPELIADPVAIIADRRLQRNQWIVSEHVVDVMVEMEINGKQSLVPIKIDGKGMQHGATIDALSISSVHGNRDAYDRLEYALAHDSDNQILTFYVNKNKATAVLRKAGHTITGWPNNSNGFIHSITDPNSPVKLRITRQTETRQFKKWFKGSKVVNLDGTPKEVYHGTSNSGFTVFNTYGGNFGLFGKGSYFTDNPEVADSYTRKGKGQEPGVYGVYLSIKNPLDMDAKADLNAWKKAFEDADLDPSYLDGVVTNEDAFRQLKENLVDDEYLRWEAEDLVTELIEGMGYDGITHIGGGRYGSKDGPKHRVYIAFEPEQIKSSTENIGTFDGNNPDIRYQERSTGTSNRALLAGAFEELVTSPDELQFLREYQENVGKLNEQEAKLQELRAQIREISFGKGERDVKKLKQLQEEATKTANRIDIYDKKLLKLERAKPLRDVLEREREKVRKATRQKGQEAMETYREKRKESAAKKEARRKIRKSIMELDKLLNRGDKKKNVKDGMSEMVSKSLKLAEALFMDEYSNRDMLRNGVGIQMTDAEEAAFREAQQLMESIESGAVIEGMEFDGEIDAMEQMKKLDGKLSGKMAKLKDVFARERKRLYGTTVSDLLGQLADEYNRLSEAEDGAIRAAKDENVYAHLLQLQKDVGGTTVRDMTLGQLEQVADAYTMVLTTVRNANKMFAKNLKFKRDTLAGMVMGEIGAAAKKISKLVSPGKDAADRFSWNNLKPVYAFERLGSQTLKTLYGNIRKGQDVWAVDMQEADAFRREQYRKHDRKNWDIEKQYSFEFESGKVDLSLEQIMSLYAYSRREAALDHLLKGGFVFGGSTEVFVKKNGIKRRYLKKDATAYNLTADELMQVIDALSAEQKAFVQEMQTYLSDVMGGKGNEVSLQMYGIKSFGEKNYFPLRSAGQYMEKAKEDSFRKEQGQISIVNSGFTKATTPHASNPITLDGFMDVWAEHVNDMAMYHGFVLPMEDFRRVYNYSRPNVEEGNSQSVNAAIENAFGKAATGYIDQLYKDLNGGAVSDNRESLGKKLVGLHKKAAVFASASVVIQQPSAFVRAFALVDPRHFIGPKVNQQRHKQLWAELKQYAPVAFVKEMGYFDTGMGKSAKDFLQAEEYSGIREKMAALFTDADYRDEMLGKAPALADEYTWCMIWEAVKRETKVRNPGMDVKSNTFLQIAGERFAEVIDKTQVYDSVLSRSANMRSRAEYMNMLTSFMAEPTTSINMLEDALRKGDRKQVKRTVCAVYGSVLLNSLLVSLVYAARDDDEDETYWEKYLSSVAVEVLDGINPITYYPFLRDIWSAFQGYDIERADMSLIADLANAANNVTAGFLKLKNASEDEEQAALGQLKDILWGMADSVASLTGLPMKNIRRDIEGARSMYQTISKDLAGRKTTDLSLQDAVLADVMNAIPIGNLLYSKSKRDQLYGALVAGDTAYVQRLRAGYESDSAYLSAIKLALRENDSRIWEAAIAWNSNDLGEYLRIAKEIRGENRFDQDDIVLAIRAEASAMEEKETNSSNTIKGYFTNEKFGVAMGQNNTAMADIIRDDLIDTKVANGKTRNEAEKAVESTARSQLKELFESGSITASAAENMLVRYGGYDSEEAADKVAEWEIETAYGFTYSNRSEAYKTGSISKAELRNMLMDVGGKTYEEAELQIQVYDWEAEGYDGATIAAVREYNEHCAGYNVPKDIYLYIRKVSNNTQNDVDASGKTINYSAMKKIMAEIGAQYRLTSAQKYAVAKSLGWSEKNIEKYRTW